MAAPGPRVKPRLRGVLHEYAFFVSIGLGVALILSAHRAAAYVGASVFAFSVAACFGASALYHRPTWSQQRRRKLARLDHAMIYVLIAGTYTPFCLQVLSSGWGIPVLSVVWSGALVAMTLKLFYPETPKWVPATIALGLGWVAIVAIQQLVKVGLPGMILVFVGGILYTVGAVVYARRRPDPYPETFGYHEVFHALTVAAAACQYVAIAFFVLPRG